MARDTLTGTRIRERRIMAGLKQADLARQAGISPSYLNLIEHNRRRIGGKLLVEIATILGVEPAALSEGAEATLIAALREAAAGAGGQGAEIARVDEFAGRFPGWADLLADSRRRIVALEQTVETLSDRLTHDPHLAAALHEMLSTVTSIRSAASILAEPAEVPPDWQRRFHRNIAEDSARLAETSRSLVTYLEAADDAGSEASAPQEEVDAILSQCAHRFETLESGEETADALTGRLAAETSPAAREMLGRHLARYATDAARVPLGALGDAVAELGPDPFRIAGRLGGDPALVMRRLAVLPETVQGSPLGLAVCDASGALTYRKPLADFPMPRFGAGCPLWPLYQALSRPMMPLSQNVALPGDGAVFLVHAIAQPRGTPAANRSPLFEAHMLVVPAAHGAPAEESPTPVGVTCRICPRSACEGRREPSILSGPGEQEF